MIQRPDGEAPHAQRTPQHSKDPVAPAEPASEQLEFDLVSFKGSQKPAEFKLDIAGDTIWATTAQIADLFGISAETAARHVASVEAERDAAAPKSPSGKPGRREVAASPRLHDLDVVLAVGYRVSSTKAAAFRKWAGAVLRAYVVDGYAINEARLREDSAATNRLAARLRAIRASETNIYDTVRAFFETASSDYDASSHAARSFAALLEEKFYFAATGETAAEIVLERADHAAPDMGLRRFDGTQPSITEARIARNYLDRDELHIMHMLCEQFLLFIQAKAIRGQAMTMQALVRKLDALLGARGLSGAARAQELPQRSRGATRAGRICPLHHAPRARDGGAPAGWGKRRLRKREPLRPKRQASPGRG